MSHTYDQRFEHKIAAYKQIRDVLFAQPFINHTSKRKLFRNRIKHGKIQIADVKPRGLWYSTDSSWLDFVAESLKHRMAKHIHALEINTSRMIRITNLHEFFAFENAFVTTDPFYPTMRQKIVDWRAVADKYTGIEIAPSLCDVLGDVFRHHYWYSNWDCASGCIWDRTIVKSVKLVASYNAGAKSYIFAKNTA